MRFPRISLPSRPRLGELVAHPVFLYAAYTLVVFVVFVIVTFPHDIVVRRALERVHNPSVDVTVAGARFVWFEGYELQNVRVAALPLREGVPPLLESARLRVRPDYAALMKGDASRFVLAADLYGGTATGTVRVRPGAVNGAVQWSGLELRRHRGLVSLLDEGEVAGTLSGSWSFDSGGGDQPAVQGNAEVVLARAGLTGARISGFEVSDLQLTEARAKATVNGNKIELQELVAAGDEINLQAGGTVTLRTPPANSILNMRVSIQKVPESYKPLLALLPRRGGKDSMPLSLNITGTAASPSIR